MLRWAIGGSITHDPDKLSVTGTKFADVSPKVIVCEVKDRGCETYVKRLQPNKLDPKAVKCYFVGYPKETIGYSFYQKSEDKVFAVKNGHFLDKEFLAKEVSGRTVQLDKITESPEVERTN